MVGTAGHIDHGKSSLVRALTGIDPDRLKEEQERGLTIDLGFAPLQLSDGRVVGMIDVPGHERFIRNMVAGSTALDVALLVVAADDSVMPQTREHLDILSLLGVRRALVALNKVDLVDPQLAALAEEEVREAVRGSPVEGARIVRVSAHTGAGIDELRAEIETLTAGLEPRSHAGHFRMPVQRVFQLKGIGTVVTGIPLSGSVRAGASIEFLPGGHIGKVRAVHAYGGKVDESVAGHSTALSVPDARAADLARGVVAAAPGIFQAGNAVDVQLRLLERSPPLAHRALVRFHTGTVEGRGMLLLLQQERLLPGDEAVARIVLADDVCCAQGDRFLLRLQNPPLTVGGGEVLRLSDRPRRYRRKLLGDELERLQAAGAQPETRIVEHLLQAGPAGATPAQLAASLAMEAGAVIELLAGIPDVAFHERIGRAFTIAVLEAGEKELVAAVERMLRDRPLAASIQRAALHPRRDFPVELQNAVLERLAQSGRIRTGTHGRILFLDRLRPLAPADAADLQRLVAACEAGGFRPPTRAEAVAAVGLPAARVEGLLARAIDEGRIEPVGEHLYGAATLRRALVAIRRNCLANREILDIPALRDELDTSRKFLIPLLEHVDGLGLTRLRGGVRCLLPSSAVSQELAAAGD
jgi:selenocysteine-specific elongation factor